MKTSTKAAAKTAATKLTASRSTVPRRSPAPTQASALAPWPSIDKFPIIIGSNLTFGYISTVMRQSLMGYRQGYVDVLAELLDHEPHAYAKLFARVLAVAGARCEVSPADDTNPKCVELADAYRRQHDALPNLTSTFERLAWALYSGVTCEEMIWARDGSIAGAPAWMIDEFQMVHSRRLSYPNWQTWDLHVWDQGWTDGFTTTEGVYGLRIADYPGKFVVHQPHLRPEYPMRDGIGRLLITYMAIKRIVLRVGAADFERFVKPWVIAYYSTALDGHPRPATDEDIAAGNLAIQSLGVGNLSSAAIPDSIKVELLRAATELDFIGFLGYLDDAITKCCIGQTFTTAPGENGARAASVIAQNSELKINRYDAAVFADSWRASVIAPWCRLNAGVTDKRLLPTIKIHVDERPDPAQVMAVAEKAAGIGVGVSKVALAKQVGLQLATTPEDAARPLKAADAAPAAPPMTAKILSSGAVAFPRAPVKLEGGT